MPLTSEDVCAVGRAAGLDAVGVAAAEPFDGTRRHLEERRAAGLHGGMHFTYGDPARSTNPDRALPGARTLVVGARRYRRWDPPAGSHLSGRVARYARADHYAELRASLGSVADHLESAGWRALVLCDDNALVDREAARRAGIGWYGKSANLLLPGQGSWFVLGSVVTDAPLRPSTDLVPDGCGSCTRCIDACPTGAIVAAGVVDARRCLAWVVQAPGDIPRHLRGAVGDRLYGCDDCQEVCPPNRAADRRGLPESEDAEAWVGLLDLLDSTDDELLDRHGRWYVPRRQPRHLRRNALVILGNVASGREPEVAGALTRALADADPMIRTHAAWAAGRLGLDHLVDRAQPDLRVEAEAGRTSRGEDRVADVAPAGARR